MRPLLGGGGAPERRRRYLNLFFASCSKHLFLLPCCMRCLRLGAFLKQFGGGGVGGRQVYVAAAQKSGNGAPAPLLGKSGKKEKVRLIFWVLGFFFEDTCDTCARTATAVGWCLVPAAITFSWQYHDMMINSPTLLLPDPFLSHTELCNCLHTNTKKVVCISTLS